MRWFAIAIFAWKVTWNYVYSPINEVYLEYSEVENDHDKAWNVEWTNPWIKMGAFDFFHFVRSSFVNDQFCSLKIKFVRPSFIFFWTKTFFTKNFVRSKKRCPSLSLSKWCNQGCRKHTQTGLPLQGAEKQWSSTQSYSDKK